MYRTIARIGVSLCLLLLPMLLAGCWSSQEIEDLAIYPGMALDRGEPAPTEKEFEAKGGGYTKRDKVMVTVQIVPTKLIGTQDKNKGAAKRPYHNVSGSGDSVLEIFRQFSIRLDRPIIGHHLKVMIMSADLLRKQTIEQVTDFVLRDNDIRPSTAVYITEGLAKDALITTEPNDIPAFHIIGMQRSLQRTSKVLNVVSLSKLDALMHSKKSFILQNLVTGGGEIALSGASIIRGSTGHWIGSLDQEDTECLAWLTGKGHSGAIKTYDWDNEPLTYEVKSMKSKIRSYVDGDTISFKVFISTEGRLIETWNNSDTPSSNEFAEKAGQFVQERLAQMMQKLMHDLQSKYKVDGAGFGDRLAIEHPAVWKRVKEDWDETFSRSKVSFSYKLKITDFGSFTED
ncbi:spore gernimation protein GerC [Paenibacillus yonginensis]|uniref:Spore gernimation protein GerC n=1 Tax=Paenibacillus yonginensis TaxID=1462996 RepID=A0A1B1N531_9BACL|nr:Ger(x)C family spore germination protein [Paenibacillus yonginensis]ANS76533.1 spore gernimation protein GerC [Paenibacillus yonginensis]